MSGFTSKADDPSYEDRAGALLAHVADMLLPGKEDWAALERLESALAPPKKPAYEYFKKSIPPTDRTIPLTEYGSYTMGGGAVAYAASDVVSGLDVAYSRKVREMLEADKRFKGLADDDDRTTAKIDMFKALYSGEPPMWTDPGDIKGSRLRDVTKAASPITKEELLKAIRKIRPDDDDEGLALTGV